MGTNLTSEDFMGLTWDQCHAIAGFSNMNQTLRDVQARVEQTIPFIEQLKAGLPEGIRIITTLQFMSGRPEYPPTVIYRRHDDGQWREYGKVVAVGGHQEFYGDGGFVTEDGVLVATDSESGYGVSVDGGTSVKFIDLANDSNARTLGGSSPERHQYTLRLLADVPEGGEEYFDCMWP